MPPVSFEDLYRSHPTSLPLKGVKLRAIVKPGTRRMAFYDLGVKRPIRLRPIGKNVTVVPHETVVDMLDVVEEQISLGGRKLGAGDGTEHTMRVLEGAGQFGDWVVQGRLLNRLPFGFVVAFGNIATFLPSSLLVKDRKPGDPVLEEYYELNAGHKIWVKVLRATREASGAPNIVVSHVAVADRLLQRLPYSAAAGGRSAARVAEAAAPRLQQQQHFRSNQPGGVAESRQQQQQPMQQGGDAGIVRPRVAPDRY